MIREAELFLLADQAMVDIVRMISDDQWDTVIPPLFDMPGADAPVALRALVAHLAYDESWVPAMLEGASMDDVGRDRFDGDLLGDDPHGAVARIADAARAAARAVADRDAVVHCGYGDVPTWDYLWQLDIARTLAAHDVAVHIGVPSPITEELARGMWEGTSPAADQWRAYGVYRAPVPVPTDASWPVRFLALTGRRAGADSAA